MAKKIGTLLVISGPSAAGKSTLISQLKDGTLPEEVRRALPPGASEWPLVDGNDILKREQTLDQALPDGNWFEGVLLHYDFIHILRVRFSETWADEPAFGLTELSNTIMFCDIRPEPANLVKHLETRSANQRKKKGLARVLWRRWVHDPLRSIRHQAQGIHHYDKADIYRNEAFLTSAFRNWDHFMKNLAGSVGDARIVRITSVMKNENLHFQLRP